MNRWRDRSQMKLAQNSQPVAGWLRCALLPLFVWQRVMFYGCFERLANSRYVVMPENDRS